MRPSKGQEEEYVKRNSTLALSQLSTTAREYLLLSLFSPLPTRPATTSGQGLVLLLGHNVYTHFMMTSLLHHQHDPEGTDCAPGGSDGNFIMSAFANSGSKPNNNQFSNCSISTMQTFIQTRGQGEGECGLTYTVTSL